VASGAVSKVHDARNPLLEASGDSENAPGRLQGGASTCDLDWRMLCLLCGG